jgi:cyclophilin family peptidyl-prolyl cis-trans isomerase
LAFRFPKLFSRRLERGPLFDQLEQRLALYNDPFLANLPTLSGMVNTGNTIVRVLLDQGPVDIEIYDKGGPAGGGVPSTTTANFLNYVNSGRYDNTFFHRLVSGFVLQGGGFFDDPTNSPQYTAVTADPPIVNEFNAHRSNVAQTVAMAKLGNDPNSATCQWFFNLVDNSSILDGQNGGFTVFGKVLSGWDTITTISNFQTRDLNTFLGGDAFGQVPLSGPNNTDLVHIIDAEVIKKKDSLDFMTESIYFPDGFRSGRIVSTLSLINQDANAPSQYEIIARYETKTRDTVISSGTLAPGAHLEVPISKAGQPSLNLVKATSPFAYIIRSTKPMGATLNHTDFGATAAEGFFQPRAFADTQIEDWSFGGGQKGDGLASYVVWENLSNVANTVTLTFYPDGGNPIVISKTTQPYRRGGLDIQLLSAVPDGLYSIHITSTRPMVAALSQYRSAPARASIELGVIAGGNTEGILPGAYVSSVGQATLTILYTQGAPTSVTVDFQFILNDGTILSNNSPVVIQSTVHRRTFDISFLNAGIPLDEYFTIRYKVESGLAPVVISYYSITGSDAIATPFQTVGSKELLFADGFTDPSSGAQGNESLTIFNPYADSATTVTYRVKFHFVDGPGGDIIIPVAGSGTLAAHSNITLSVRSLPEVMARIASDPKFRHYSISVSADFTRGGGSVDGAVFAQLTRLDPAGNTMTTGPTFVSGVSVFLADNGDFGPP